MRKSTKRLISLVICLVMMTVVFSMPVYAVEADSHDCRDCAEHERVSDGHDMLRSKLCSMCGLIGNLVDSGYYEELTDPCPNHGSVCIRVGEWYAYQYVCPSNHTWVDHLLRGYRHVSKA